MLFHMILSCQHIEKQYIGVPVLRDVHFHLEAGDKAALIGVNGAGKTTLLRLITGEEKADGGELVIPGGTRIGHLRQIQSLEGDCTIYEEIRKARADLLEIEASMRSMEAAMTGLSDQDRPAHLARYEALTQEYERRNGYASESEIQGVLRGLGFPENQWQRKLSSLSGGQKTRVVLGRLLLEEPDILLLDEPTNHLDASSVEWLETRLSRYSGTLLLVSHDRYFLDKLATRVIEIENGRSLTYTGNYTAFREKKEALRAAELHAYEKQEQEIRHQEEVIRKLRQFNREKSIKRAESREKLLERTERLDKPQTLRADMGLRLNPLCESGVDVCTGEGLRAAYDRTLFEDLSVSLRRGERVALIGSNGCGKTTLLRILAGERAPDAGNVHIGSQVLMGYYDQEQHLLHDEKTVFDEIYDRHPEKTQTELRNHLAAFLFTGDDVFKKISTLSGGERARVTLASLMLSGANFLLLDEPTNHLDIPSREILESALASYSGTVLYVSHDRYFINRTATRVLEMHAGRLTEYLGNYDDYLAHRDAGNTDPMHSVHEKEEKRTSAAASWKADKEQQAKKRREMQRLRDCEDAIACHEDRLREIDRELSLPETGFDLERCQSLSEEQGRLQKELDELYLQWEELAQ